MDSDSCSISYKYTLALADAKAASDQQTSFESEMSHLYSIASWFSDSKATADNTNYAVSALMTPSSDDDKSGALGFGVALATSLCVALAF